MTIAVLPLSVWALVVDRSRFPIPHAAVMVTSLAIVPLLQAVSGLVRFAGDGWLAAIYLLGFAAAIAIGARAQHARASALPNLLFASLGVAAMLSLGLAFHQWLRLDWLGLLALPLPPDGRPTANVAQANHLATLLVWGLLAFWWAYVAGRLRGAVCVLAAMGLLFGVAMTQSRAGALEILLLGVAAFVFRGPLRTPRYAGALVVLGVWFAVAFVSWVPLNSAMHHFNEAMELGQVQSIEQRVAPGTRLLHWQLLLDAAMQRPWTGWGWNQVVLAQVALATAHPAAHEVISYSHNLVLDLIIWNGFPVALVVCVGIAAWGIGQFVQARQAVTPERPLLLAAVAVFLLHAQLELPHGYTLFLLPVGLMVGALNGGPREGRRELALPRAAVALPLAALALSVAVVMRDYLRIEEAWSAYRMEAARIGTLEPGPVPQITILTQLEALLRDVRIEPRSGMPSEEIEKLRLLAERQPGAGSLFRYAQASALNGRSTDARRALDVLCRLHNRVQCQSAKSAWVALASNGRPEMRAAWPPAY